jgi:hypothetical protein
MSWPEFIVAAYGLVHTSLAALLYLGPRLFGDGIPNYPAVSTGALTAAFLAIGAAWGLPVQFLLSRVRTRARVRVILAALSCLLVPGPLAPWAYLLLLGVVVGLYRLMPSRDRRAATQPRVMAMAFPPALLWVRDGLLRAHARRPSPQPAAKPDPE